MVTTKSSRLIVLATILAVGTCLSSSQAMAYNLGDTWSFYWTTGTAWEMDLRVDNRVYRADSDGVVSIDYGGGTDALDVDEYYFVYVYDIYVGSVPSDPGTNSENFDWFQVKWVGNDPSDTDQYDVPSHLDWSDYLGKLEPSVIQGDHTTRPTASGDWLTWDVGLSDSDYCRTPDNWIGTVWATSPLPPTMGLGQAPNSGAISAGELLVPGPWEETVLPEPGTYALLALALGVPFYFRRRKS